MTNLDKALSDFSEKSKTSKVNPKLKKALKVAGTVGAIGALGAAGAIAGDALNLWDLGEVGGVAGKVLSPLDKAGNALNAMASAPVVKELNRSKKDYQDLVDDMVKVGLSHDQGNKTDIHPIFGDHGKLGFHVYTTGPNPKHWVDRKLYSSTISMEDYVNLPSHINYK